VKSEATLLQFPGEGRFGTPKCRARFCQPASDLAGEPTGTLQVGECGSNLRGVIGIFAEVNDALASAVTETQLEKRAKHTFAAMAKFHRDESLTRECLKILGAEPQRRERVGRRHREIEGCGRGYHGEVRRHSRRSCVARVPRVANCLTSACTRESPRPARASSMARRASSCRQGRLEWSRHATLRR